MIVPMKKTAIIVQSKDADSAIRSLRSLGVLHVEHQRTPEGKTMSSLRGDLALIKEALDILSAPELPRRISFKNARLLKDWLFAARHIVDLHNRLNQLKEYSRATISKIREWEEWGDFNPEDVETLREKGVYIRLYQIPSGEIDNLPEGVIVRKISALRGIVNCAVISREAVEIPFKEVAPPKSGVETMRSRLAEDRVVMEAIEEGLRKYTIYRERLSRIKMAFEKELKVHEALTGMGRAGEIVYITGYVPYDAAAKLSERARSEKWGIVINDPSEEDSVPTLIRNPRWISLIEPAFRFLEIVPGYREIDISPLFLLFLGLFFGMIVGDAGYGALYISLTFVAQKMLGQKTKDKKVFFLLYFFSACAVLWGALTGTVFGQEWCLKAGLRPLLPVLKDTKFLQMLCFLIGAFHLTLGQLWQAARKLPSLAALADVGWTLVLWAAFFLARTLILSYPLPPITNWLIIAGVSLVIFFANPQRNVLKMMAGGLGTVALSIMNNFTDVVSYIRLFAVGLAGIAISDTVNALAASLGKGSLFAQIFILFIGHTINIVLGPISVLVHGVRLNVLEFSGHAGLSWSGTPYRPLEE